MSRFVQRFVYSLVLVTGMAELAYAEGPYKVVNTVSVGGKGAFDYVLADSDGRRLYVPRSGGSTSRVSVFDLDTLKPVGEVAKAEGVRGVAVDSKSHHGFTSSKPVLMFDTQTLETLKTIDVQGSPDGILFDPASERVFVFSHRAPNATVIDSKDGKIVGTLDLGGAPEQGVSDGEGHIYVDIEDKDNVAVVDSKALKVTAHYPLGESGKGPAGLALDAKNHILFACCRSPQNAVILNADSGKIITSVPIGSGVDGATFNPNTQEAFTSQRDGTLTVIKETGPESFEVEQNVKTKAGARTSTLDVKTNQVYFDYRGTDPASQGGRARWLPNSLMVIVVGK